MAQVVIERPVAAHVNGIRIEDFASGAKILLPSSMVKEVAGRDLVAIELDNVVEFADLITQYLRARPKAKGPKKTRRPRAPKATPEPEATTSTPAVPAVTAAANGSVQE